MTFPKPVVVCVPLPHGDNLAEPGEELHGLRFRAGPVCAYVAQRAGQPAQVEFQVFAEEPCTLERVLHELPALVAILHDPSFQIAVGWPVAQSTGELC